MENSVERNFDRRTAQPLVEAAGILGIDQVEFDGAPNIKRAEMVLEHWDGGKLSTELAVCALNEIINGPWFSPDENEKEKLTELVGRAEGLAEEVLGSGWTIREMHMDDIRVIAERIQSGMTAQDAVATFKSGY